MICLMSAIPCCFPSQRAIRSYLLALWILNFSIIELTVIKQQRFLLALATGWNETACLELFPLDSRGDRGYLGCDTMGATQDCAGRGGGQGVVRTEAATSLSWAPASWPAQRLHRRIQKVGGEAHDSVKQVQIRWKWTGKVPILSLVTGQTWLMLTLMHYLGRLLGAAGAKGFVSRCQELMHLLWKLSLQVPTRFSGDTSASLLGGDWSCPF